MLRFIHNEFFCIWMLYVIITSSWILSGSMLSLGAYLLYIILI